KPEVCAVYTAPGSGIRPEDNHLAAEVQDVTSADERHLVRNIEIILFVVGEAGRPGAEAVNVGDRDCRKNVCLADVQAQLRRPTLAERVGRDQVVLTHESDPKFINKMRC